VNHIRRTRHGIVVIVLGLVATSIALAQAPSTEAPGRHVIVRAGRLLDVRSGTILTNVAISIDGDRILAVGPADDAMTAAPAGARVIDLGGATVLPA
jgi:adenine deaminase